MVFHRLTPIACVAKLARITWMRKLRAGMTKYNSQPGVIIPAESRLFETLQQFAESHRMVFFAGLPGVGKSLLIHQFAHMAHASGRSIHLLQWDTARPPFETEAILARYPEVDGITHGMIRKAAGLWARDAVLTWHRRFPDLSNLLIGETPLIGNRLIELARPQNDESEALLQADGTRFIIPVPSPEVRQAIESARIQTSTSPQNAGERADAIPKVVRELWEELGRVAHRLGVASNSPQNALTYYDPQVYEGVYTSVLKHRHHEVVPVDIVLSIGDHSVYDFEIDTRDVIPSAADVATFVQRVEHLYPDTQDLDREMRDWYVT